MKTFLPLPHRCVITRPAGTNVFGEPLYSKGVPQACHVLRAVDKIADTTVRADSSGSRGHAEENLADLWMLIRPTIKIATNDMVDVQGMKFRIVSIQQRNTVFGEFDHFEVLGQIEQG